MKKSSYLCDPNTEKVPKNAACWDKTQHAGFSGNPLYQALDIAKSAKWQSDFSSFFAV